MSADKPEETGAKCQKCGAPMFKSQHGFKDYCREPKCFFGTDDEREILAMVCPGM